MDGHKSKTNGGGILWWRRICAGMACWAICLLPSGALGAPSVRDTPLQIGDGDDTTITFSVDGEDGGDNVPANGFTDPFTGEDGSMLSIDVSGNSSGNSTSAALFGAGQTYGDSTFDDWTVEFLGSGTMTTAGYHPDSGAIYLGTLGGDRNSNFRFYFNNGDADEATVNIAALKLDAPVAESAGQAAMTLAADQGNGTYARAISLGPNFQLNIGRARTLGPQREDATCETEDSIASGGHQSDGTGTMNIFSAIIGILLLIGYFFGLKFPHAYFCILGRERFLPVVSG